MEVHSTGLIWGGTSRFQFSLARSCSYQRLSHQHLCLAVSWPPCHTNGAEVLDLEETAEETLNPNKLFNSKNAAFSSSMGLGDTSGDNCELQKCYFQAASRHELFLKPTCLGCRKGEKRANLTIINVDASHHM